MNKTLENWQESNKDFLDYINPMDEIDEDLYNHFLEITVPKYAKRYNNQDCYQIGEAFDEVDNVFLYETFTSLNGKYFYLGILPEFKQ